MARHSGSSGQLLVSACGRTLSMDMQCARSVMELQNALQAQLQMESQSFNFFDVNGNTLSTDSEIREAIGKGLVPICATLTDASIHFIENRREELAQMQWKLVRDQMTAAGGKLVAMQRQSAEVEAQLHQYRQESTSLIDRVHKEALRAVESERDVAHCELRQLSERVNAVAQLVQSERQKRDVALQGLEKQFTGLRDLLDKERDSRRQELIIHSSVVQELRQQLDAERSEREALKDKHVFDIHTVMEKAEAFQTHFTSMIHDERSEATNRADSWQKSFQAQGRDFQRVRVDMENMAQDMKVRFLRVEERCTGLENRVAEITTRQAASVDRLVERHERVSQVVESLRLEEKQNKDQVQMALTRMKELQTSLEETEETAHKLVLQERQGRADQVRSAQLALITTHKKEISELEEKIADRLERESSERERHVQAIYEEVGRKSPIPVMPMRSLSASPLGTSTMASKVEVMTSQGTDSCYSPSVSGGTMTLATGSTPMTGATPIPGATMPIPVSVGSLQAPAGMMQRATIGGTVSPINPATLSPPFSTRPIALSRVCLPMGNMVSRSSSSKRL